jgi:actin-related protein
VKSSLYCNFRSLFLHFLNIRFTVAESLFHSSLLTEEKLKLLGLSSVEQYKSIVDCVIDAVHRSETDVKRELYYNIILSGGTTLLPGFKERLEKELAERLHNGFRVRVVTTSAGLERRNGVWIGGSILASLGEHRACSSQLQASFLYCLISC